ncbi:MAG TPA: hypothetical protein VK846_10775 [Candidatus Limnocylindria bacterium]|nr:hypothetical protein [Candidatus Limnocylindria bacterium]
MTTTNHRRAYFPFWVNLSWAERKPPGAFRVVAARKLSDSTVQQVIDAYLEKGGKPPQPGEVVSLAYCGE